MPLPFLLGGAAAVAGLAGLVKGGQAISNNAKAKDLIEDAEYKYDKAKSRMENQRDATTFQLETLGELKLTSWSEDIGTFVKLFEEFKKVELASKVHTDVLLEGNIQNVGELKQMQVAAVKATEVIQAGFGSLGAGALAGIASYGGAMMFASASTGTAIASLSGVAATNATLAWFGGGSLAAGGFGMAGGSLVLGGIVAGPALAVAGFIMAAKSEENLAEAKKVYAQAKHAAEQMNTITSFMENIEELARAYEEFINDFRKQYMPMLEAIEQIKDMAKEEQSKLFLNKVRKLLGIRVKVDFTLLTEQEQQVLHMGWLMTQVLHGVLSASLLTKEGEIDQQALPLLESAEKSTTKMLELGA